MKAPKVVHNLFGQTTDIVKMAVFVVIFGAIAASMVLGYLHDKKQAQSLKSAVKECAKDIPKESYLKRVYDGRDIFTPLSNYTAYDRCLADRGIDPSAR
jgi:uncharacterized protein YpmB